jgi:uncharacterized protein (TIGR02145 family)
MLTNSCKKEEIIDPPNTIRDIDGNLYHTVTIGTQIWMLENLKVTHYRNGVPIPNITDSTIWCNIKKGAYCDYDNNPINSKTYGKLYNWYAVADSNNLCPKGWHIPSNEEWTTLTDYLGGIDEAAGKLKEIDTIHWQSPNIGATNTSGFTALPGGWRIELATFIDINRLGKWWSSSYGGPNTGVAKGRSLYYDFNSVGSFYYSMQCGLSVRCIKDN